MENVFAIYKPKGPTSNDIVQQIKKLTSIKKVGHAGTLDPLAKGVLVVGVGRSATKQLGAIVQKEKEYLATIRLGVTSTTDDAEGVKTQKHESTKTRKHESTKALKLKEIKSALNQFTGEINQIPPLYSAVKIEGKEAYKLARKQLSTYEVNILKKKLKPRIVIIKKIQFISYHWPYLKIKVITGPGVYIRSLARDIGEKLNVGGYLYNLERTRVGRYMKKDAIAINKIANKISN